MKHCTLPTLLGFQHRQLLLMALLFCLSLSSVNADDTPTDKQNLQILKTFVGEFVAITPGTGKFPKIFQMGSTAGSTAEQPVREIAITHSFSIAKYEIYQNIYTEIMGGNPSRWQGPRNSAEQMTQQEAVVFCNKATARLRQAKLITNKQFIRLPTEAEWEYCTRAGTATPYSFGETATKNGDQDNQAALLNEYAWHTGNAAGNDPEVGVLKPNPWGLFDVHGYLAEYCIEDWKGNHSPDAKTDPEKVVIRGGSWKDAYPLHTSSTRRPFPKNGRDDAVGFRCVLAEEREKQ